MILPVIERELREVARQRFTYTLRTLGVLALLASFAFALSPSRFRPSTITLLSGIVGSAGGELFARFHATLFWAIWILVPVASADSISRERREGTLGLLFLTPLNPRAIVYAKSVVQGLRALTLWLAVLPVLTICLLAGGVAWTDVLISALVNLSSIALAMGAGLVASSLCKVWTRSLSLAVFLSAVLLGVFLWAAPLVTGAYLGTASFQRFSQDWDLMQQLRAGAAFATNEERLWQQLPMAFGVTTVNFLVAMLLLSLLVLLLFFFLVGFCASRLRRDREDQPASAFSEEMKQMLFTPLVARRLLSEWLNWELRRNPIGWLERRSWSGRLVMWSWFAIVACVYSSLFSNLTLYQHAFHLMQSVLATLLAGSIAFSAAGSFRRERETGVLELLLVAPLREWQIILGRVRGLWSQFVPAITLLCVVWLWGARFLSTTNELGAVVLYLVTFATIPVVGLYFSLARTNFIAAMLWTLAVQILVPMFMAGVVAFLFPYTYRLDDSRWTQYLVIPILQVMIALLFGWRLYENLKARTFATA